VTAETEIQIEDIATPIPRTLLASSLDFMKSLYPHFCSIENLVTILYNIYYISRHSLQVNMALLNIQLLGQFKLTNERQVHEIYLPRTIQALFACLLVARNHFIPRESLADLLWNESNGGQSRHNLNTALWRLRSSLEKEFPHGDYLQNTQSGDVCFNLKSDYWLDLAEFEQQASLGLASPAAELRADQIQNLEKAAHIYSGDLLDGYYYDWAVRERERIRLVYISCLSHLLNCYTARQQPELSLDYARRILAIDPLREDIHAEVMRSLLALGRRSEAINQFEQCRALLHSEMGIEPYAELRELQRLALQPATPQPGSPAAFKNPDTTLAELRRAHRALENARDQVNDCLRLIDLIKHSLEPEQP
jgi:DNA-binding SARP family transcriptional activator